jgi:succinoglycan biosynthesis transport protein ExoP
MASPPQTGRSRVPGLADAPEARTQPAGRPPTGPVGEPAPRLLENFLRIVRVRKWWVLQGLILVPLVVTVLSLRQEERYTATANLLFREAPAAGLEATDTTLSDPAREAATNDGILTLPVIAQRAARQLGGGITAADVQSSVSVGPSAESDLVQIDAVWTDPAVAARMANAYGDAYIDFRRSSDRRQLQQAIDLARQRLDALPPDQQDDATAASLRERLNRLLLAQSLLTGNAELVQRASAPTKPSSPDLRRNLLLGLVLGGALGLGLAALRERLDQSIKTDAELEEIYRAPVLVRLPRNRKLAETGPEDVLASAEAESLRILRANLRYFDVDDRLRSILVSSPMSGDGKSTVARQLAMIMAGMGDHVVLVEADLHKATSSLLRDAHAGLSTVLAGGSLDDAIVPVEIGDTGRRLAVLPSGPVPPNPVELLESNRMVELLSVLERRYELVIVDSPALAQVSDARPLVAEVSGILIVSALGHTTRSAAMDFRKQLQLLEGHPLGVVANFAPTVRSAYYT